LTLLAAPDESKETTGKRVAKATGVIMVFHVLRFALGFLEKPLLAKYFGTTWTADAYTVAYDVVLRIWLIFEKVINPSFLPCFIKSLRDEGEERAWRFTNTVASLMLTFLIACAVLGIVAATGLVRLWSPNASTQEAQLTAQLARIMLCGLVFLGLSSLTYVILNGYKHFALPALGDALWKGCIVAAMVLLVPRIPNKSLAVVALAGGFVLGSLGKLLPQVVGLWNKRHLFRWQLNLREPLLKEMLVLIAPLLVGILVSELREVFLLRLANDPSIGEGGRAALHKYARPPVEVFIQIFPYALSIGIFPYLAELAGKGTDRQHLTDVFVGALRVCAFVFVPMSAAFIALRYPLIRALFESGKFGRESVELTVVPFTMFALGMVFFASEMMINQTYYAMTNTFTPTAVGVGTSAFVMLFAWASVEMGHGLGGIALAGTLGKGAKCVILIYLLRSALGDLRARENFVFLTKVIAATVVTVAVSLFVSQHFVAWLEVDRKMRLLNFLISGMAAVGVYAVCVIALRVEEAGAVVAFVKRGLRR
jgi:murein biosynthesis integral membrane protein MurJ